MRLHIPLAVLLALLIGGCASTVVRNKTVYESEVKFLSNLTQAQGELLSSWVEDHCVCTSTATFTTSRCQKSAEHAVLVKARLPWNFDMMLFNARITETDPGEIPAVPAPSTLCPAPKEK